MKYVEMTIEEAYKECNKHAKVLVAMQDLENEDTDIVFVPKMREEYKAMFKNVQTVASIHDDFVRQLKLFTERQDILNIKPNGVQKIVILKSS